MADPATTVPAVTVLMPAHNAARHLEEALQSVLGQTFGDLELLVIDDGSTDGTSAIMARSTDPRVRYVRHTRNRGLVAVLNEGLDQAKGRYIARMDADDVMMPTRLEEQTALLDKDPGLALVATFVDLIGADGNPLGQWNTDRAASTEKEIRDLMPRTNCIAHPSVMIRRSALGDLRYAPDQTGAEDWDLWLRLLARGHRIGKIPRPLLRYRVHPASVMAASKKHVPLAERLLRARRRYLSGEWRRGRFDAFQLRVIAAQWRTRAGVVLHQVLPDLARNIHRLLTYSPFKLLKEQHQLKQALANWQGRHVFVFSYLNTGGAEQVHADIMATVADRRPLIVITGFSKDQGFAEGFAACGHLLEIPRLLHHPFTAKAAQRRIVAAINTKEAPVLFGSNTDHFFHWLPLLKPSTRALQLIHAFLYQPQGNTKHKAWLALYDRVERYIFISRQARQDFRELLRVNGITREVENKLEFIPNAVHGFGTVTEVQRPLGVLFVGRDAPEKRPELFLRLAERLERGHPGVFRFTAVGISARDRTTVDLPGTITDPDRLRRLYAEHDLLVVTSSREGFPLVIMEAMAQGTVPVTPPVGDVPNRLEPSFSVVTSSVEAEVMLAEMEQALMALASDPVRLKEMKRRALERARSEFDPEAFRARYRALLMMPASSA
ncbi:MAG TPA: glycosyltransferase [Flavobacteriales bacterium]